MTGSLLLNMAIEIVRIVQNMVIFHSSNYQRIDIYGMARVISHLCSQKFAGGIAPF